MNDPVHLLGLFAVAAVLSAAGAVAENLDALAAQAAKYESGVSEEPLRRIEQLLREGSGEPARRAESEAVLIGMLAPETTFEAKRFACCLLAAYGSETALPALAALLKREETAGIACFALGRISSAKAGDCLRAALAEVKGLPRVQIAVTLGQRAEAESVKPLTGLVRDPDSAAARAAIRALGAIDTGEAREAVAALRRDADPAWAADLAAASLSLADKRLAAGDRKAAAALCADLVRADLPPHVRRGAFGLLLACDADGGVERVRQSLEASRPDPVLAPVALAHIVGLRGKKVSKEFGGLLPRLPPAEQVLLVEALACRGDADARAVIREQVGAAEPTVRRAAIGAVGKLEDASAVALLVQASKAAATPDEGKEIQAALASLRGGETTDQALVEVLRRAADKDKVPLIEVMARRGGREAAALLLELSGATDEQVARAAGQALARIAEGGDAASLAVLQKAAAGGDPRQREAALRALTAWRGFAAWDTVAGIYLKPENEAQRTLALRGLVRMAGAGNAQPDAVLIGRYRQLLDGARGDADRKMILNTLAGVAHPDALALALPLLEVPGVRAEAAQAVERIALAIQKTHPDLSRDALKRVKGGGI